MTVEEMPSHTHNYKLFVSNTSTVPVDAKQGKFLAAQKNAAAENGFVCGPGLSVENHLYSSGKGASHMNMQPYKAVYIFLRLK